MTHSDKLAQFKTMLEIVGNEQDDVLESYLSIAETVVLRRAYPFEQVEVVPPKYEQIQLEIAVYLWNKRGAEGETAHNELGVNRSYESADVPESMLRIITPKGGVL